MALAVDVVARGVLGGDPEVGGADAQVPPLHRVLRDFDGNRGYGYTLGDLVSGAVVVMAARRLVVADRADHLANRGAARGCRRVTTAAGHRREHDERQQRCPEMSAGGRRGMPQSLGCLVFGGPLGLNVNESSTIAPCLNLMTFQCIEGLHTMTQPAGTLPDPEGWLIGGW